LFVGERGVGKKQLALDFSKRLLCSNKACGHCQSCYLFDAQTHPDLIRIEPESGQTIKIDQIREVIAFVSQTPSLGGYRIIIIDPARAMNINAANALLKTLEEPTPNTLLILISDSIPRLPATILSRCQKIIFQQSVAEDEPFKQDFYNGLRDLTDRKIDPLTLAERWHEKNSELLLKLFFSWVLDLLRLRVSQKLSLEPLLSYSDHIQKTNRFIQTGFNLNQRLWLEELLIKWVVTYAAC